MTINLQIALLSLPLLLFLIYLVFSFKRVNGAILLLIGLYPIIILFAINPKWRIYSYHSLWHTAIVYRIAGGEIPPIHPFLGGEPLRYCWGNHLIASVPLKAFTLAPSYAFALINIISLALSMVLVAKISRLMINNQKVSIYSVICSLFGFSFIHPIIIRWNNPSQAVFGPIRLEFRGIPAAVRFCNTNCLPPGMLFFLLYLWAMIRIYQDRTIKRMSIYLAFAILGCGFFYSPFLPGIIAGMVCLCPARVYLSRETDRTRFIKRSLLALAVLLGSLALLSPHLVSIHSGWSRIAQLFNWTALLKKTAAFALVSAPVLILIGINPGFIKNRLARGPLITVIAVAGANLGCYLLVHAPRDNEYIFLILLSVTLGIIGGAAWYAFQEKFGRWATFFLLLLFLTPFYLWIQRKSGLYRGISLRYAEEGGYLHSNDREEEELCRWIKGNLPADAMIIDSDPGTALLTGRQLFYPVRMGRSGKPFRSLGPGFPVPDILMNTGHNPNLLRKRRVITEKIFRDGRRLSDDDWKYLHTINIPLFLVVRSEKTETKFADNSARPIFSTSHDRFRVYQILSSENKYSIKEIVVKE